MRARVFGERTDGCVNLQCIILSELGIPEKNISMQPHKTIPGSGHFVPGEWIRMLNEIKKGASSKDVREKYAHLIQFVRRRVNDHWY